MFQSKLNILFISLTLIGFENSFAQNIKADIVSINKTYHAMDKFSMIFELNMYETYQSQKIYFTQSGSIFKNGKNTFQKFDDSECLNTPQYSVILDKEEKEIVYAPKKGNFDIKDPGMSLNFDSILMFCKSTQFKKVSDELFSYTFTMLDSYPEYNQIVLFFNPKTYLLQKIIFYCEEDDISVNNDKERFSKSRIEINYKDINVKPVLNNSDFSYEKYLVKSGDKFELKSAFKGYHLTVLSF